MFGDAGLTGKRVMTGLPWRDGALRLSGSVRLIKRSAVERIETAENVLAQARETLRATEALKDDTVGRARDAAWKEGFSAGHLEGLLAAREAWAREFLERQLEDAGVFRSIRGELADLVMSCLKSLLSEFDDEERFVRLTERVLDSAGQSRRIRLHVAPSRRAHAIALTSPAADLQQHPDFDVLEDPSLGPEDCLLETDAGMLDGRLRIRLQCIEDLLAQRLSEVEWTT